MNDLLKSYFVGQLPRTVSYFTWSWKYKDGDNDKYGSEAIAGDKITMTIDTRPMEYSVSFAKNGLDMGKAFSGLNNWKVPIYILFSFIHIGDRIKIINYEV